MSRLAPLYVFDDAAEWYRRHSSGVELEFKNESKEISDFNNRQYKFSAWAVAKLHSGKDKTLWVFLVRPGEGGAEHLFPREGETCEMLLWNKSGKTKRWEKPWEAERIENPAASFGFPDGPAHRMPAFKLKVPNNVPGDIIRPLADDPDEVGYDAPSRLSKKYALSDKRAYRVTVLLRLSSATRDAEMGAINKVFKNPHGNLTPKQEAAFKYLLDFKSAPFTVNLFNHFPHLRDPMNNPGGMPHKVITMLKGFNDHQRDAYKAVLSSLPCGVGIIPGGPGAGKTHWNLVVTAAIQSKNLTWYAPDNCSHRSAKVLYILDINKPLDDTCNKIVKLYKSLGLKKRAVRLYGWRYSFDAGKPNFVNKFMFIARMNRYRRQTFNETCLAPTLDELVWDFYEANKTGRYRDLHELLSKALGGSKAADPPVLRGLVNELYRDVLIDHVDFIATTPVPAATGFSGMFKPDIVIFDESPHAREASTMVAIAQFEPIAWIFSGDHRQTRPFVASDDARDNYWAPQMLVSMMERSDRAGAIRHSLLINHRAYGRLQHLASGMFYNKMMISGHKNEGLFPPSVAHLQRYLERFLPPGQECREPRLLVYDGNRTEIRAGTSWYNLTHISWVMERVQELLKDSMFKQVGKNERGTILIISPYKESYMKYKRAIKDLPSAWQARLNIESRVEARTIDTVQGGEADFVFLDMVRAVATDFTDDPNRLNVALTRARQAEIVLMHPDSEPSPHAEVLTLSKDDTRELTYSTVRRGAYHLSRVFAHCHAMKQVVDITERLPRRIAQVPNEERAYEEHVSYQRQFDEERVAFGLDPRSSSPRDKQPPPADTGDSVLDEDGEPQSIFASQFAGLADFMQSILDEKKAKDESQPQANDSASTRGSVLHLAHQGQPQDVLDATPSKVTNGLMTNGIVTVQTSTLPGQTGKSLPAVSQPVINRSTQEKRTQESIGATANNTATQTKGPGLTQSRWRDGPEDHAPNMSFQNCSSVMPMQSGQAMPSAQSAPPAAQQSPASTMKSTAALNGAARSSVVKAKEPSSTLPSGSCWW